MKLLEKSVSSVKEFFAFKGIKYPILFLATIKVLFLLYSLSEFLSDLCLPRISFIFSLNISECFALNNSGINISILFPIISFFI